jgi:hypothetical protein
MHATSNKLWCNPTENTNGVHLGMPHPTVFSLIMILHVKAEHCMIAFVRYIILIIKMVHELKSRTFQLLL